MALDVPQSLGFFFAILFYGWAIYHILLFLKGRTISRKRKDEFDPSALRNPYDLPTMSIIIPAKNEEATIGGAIEHVISLAYPKEKKQTILLEDGSTDNTPHICRKYARQHSNVLFLRSEVSKGKPAALNRAMPHIKGDVVSFLDSDNRMTHDILLRVAKYFHDNPNIDAVQLIPNTFDVDDNLITRLDAYETWFWYNGVLRGKEALGLFVHFSGSGIFLRKEIMDKTGGWDEDCLAEDMDYAKRIADGGGTIGVLSADVWRQPPYSSTEFVKQRKRWWAGNLQVLGKGLRTRTKSKASLRKRVDMTIQVFSPVMMLAGSLFFFSILSFQIFTSRVVWLLLTFLLGILTSQIVVFPLVLVKTISKRDPSYLLLIPGLFYYWFLHFIALLWAATGILFRRKMEWEVTEKRKME
ncbi:MAG: glycosyltransferase [Thermoplasmata archaeon]